MTKAKPPKVVDRQSSEDWLRQAFQPKRKHDDQESLIAVEWTPRDHPTKVQQQRPKESWDVVVRDFLGGEFCRRSFLTEVGAKESEVLLRKKLTGCNGNVLAALGDWMGRPVQVPLWWGDVVR